MDKINKTLEQMKVYLARYDKRTKIIAGVSALALIIAAATIAILLNMTEYAVLFSNVTSDEATQIVSRLQEDGVEYKYEENGNVLVDKNVVDQVRADLVYEGYPKSGFTYDIFTQYIGGMTTDSEKQQLELYELQDRMSATIRMFEGVSDAKVSIAVAEADTYVLTDDANDGIQSTASVLVSMENGRELSPLQAQAIQRLVAFGGVPGLLMENVRVFDSNGMEVTVIPEDNETSLSQETEEFVKLIEKDMQEKVLNVLGPFYGAQNVKVSVNGEINVDNIIRESIIYTTPDKIDETDKDGIVSSESGAVGVTYPDGTTVDVAGTETNAEATQYNGGVDDGGTVVDENYIRDYLVNQVIEQTEIGKGALEDLTVSVSINSNGTGNITEGDLLNLIGNATGIEEELRDEKITIVASPFFGSDDVPGDTTPQSVIEYIQSNPIPFIIGLVVLLLVIIIIVVIVMKKRKRRMAEELEEEERLAREAESLVGLPDISDVEQDEAQELRDRLRDFATENPEIFAHVLKSWLNGGEVDGN